MHRGVELPGSIVSGEWLSEHGADVAVLDCRWYLDGRSGRAAYEAGHIPGARWIDLDADLSAPPARRAAAIRCPPPTSSSAHSPVAASPRIVPWWSTTTAGGSIAARAWWLLHLLDQPVAVLDGGIAAWPGELTADVPAGG